jgi:hypothetical protein
LRRTTLFARGKKAPYLAAMTLRPPRSQKPESRDNALDYEIVQEQAAALGRLGRALEAALAALAAYDRACAEHIAGQVPSVRESLVQDASHALWCFIIQREASGLRDQRLIMQHYRVPREVQNRMGVFGGGRRSSTFPTD